MDNAVKCSKGCHKYNKTTDEIVEAATKHKEAALALKEIGEKQKKKIKIYKQQIESLELEARDHENLNDKIKRKNHVLETEIVALEKNLRTNVPSHDVTI